MSLHYYKFLLPLLLEMAVCVCVTVPCKLVNTPINPNLFHIQKEKLKCNIFGFSFDTQRFPHRPLMNCQE